MTVDGTAPHISGRLLELRVAAAADRLKLVRTVVAEAVTLAGGGPECVADVVLAVDEACQNVIRHAYGGDSRGDMVITLSRDGDWLEVVLVDFAPPVDPGRIRPRDLNDIRPGGLGTHIIREVMDAVEYTPAPPGAGNRVRMTKRIR